MRWTDACTAYPARWIVVETTGAKDRADIRVVELCADGCAAKHRCRELCLLHPDRTFCFFHTSYPKLEFAAA
jgi:hypothetical protein